MEWGMIIVMVLVIPFVTLLPALFLAGLFFGLYEFIRDGIRGKVTARRKPGERATETLNIQ
jgi:hypothetical protein